MATPLRPEPPPVCVFRDGNRLRFSGYVRDQAVRELLSTLAVAVREGVDEVILDFTEIARAYPDSMLAIVAVCDHWRSHGVEFAAVPPNDESLARLFANCNWLFLLQPERYDESAIAPDRHVPARRYRSSDEQQDLVNAYIDVVMQNMQLDRAVLAGLEWAINEITDNVLFHAEAANGGVVQVSTFRDNHEIAFVVADAGRGVLTSMHEGHPALVTDLEAIGEAVKRGVSRSHAGQGNGLAGTLALATLSRGSFSLTSGRGQFLVFGDEPQDQSRNGAESEHFAGTVVSVRLKTETPLRLEDALNFGTGVFEVWDRIDSHYTEPDGEALVLRLADETTGFGNRIVGGRIQTKIRNLLDADPTKPLILDWDGVPFISSSFADEAIAKLFVDIGPTAFGGRIKHRAMDALVRRLIDAAILQRASQTIEMRRHSR